MIRIFSAALVAATFGLTIGFAQDIVPVNHGPHHAPVIVDGGACASGQCGTCSDCVRITEIKKTQHPVYSCKIKEVCVPNCGFFGLFGNCGGCTKIEVKQLVKKYRTDEECVSKCVTAEEAAKHYEAEAKKAAEKAKEQAPVAPPAPAKLPAGAISNQSAPAAPDSIGRSQQSFLGLPIALGRK